MVYSHSQQVTVELRRILPDTWQVDLPGSTKGIVLKAPSAYSGNRFLDDEINHLTCIAQRLDSQITIDWQGCRNPLVISPKLRMSVVNQLSGQPKVKPEQIKQPVLLHPDSELVSSLLQANTSKQTINWNLLNDSVNSIWISNTRNNRNLFVNDAVLTAQSDKPADELLADTANTLNPPEELESRTKRILSNESLFEYQYKAYRWCFDSDLNIWIRQWMQFTSTILPICYLRQQCWIEEVLKAEPLGQHVDTV